MAEIVGALAELLVALIAALIQLCITLVGVVLEALGFGVAHLAEKPKEGESRFSGKRLLVASAPLVVVLLAIGGMFAFFHWQAEVRRARNLATRTLVEEHASRLAAQVDQRGHFVKHPGPTLDVNDAWGNPLRVAYKETLTHQVVAVHSAGNDEEPNTPDDLSSSQKLLRPKPEIAMDLFDKVKGAIEDRMDDREP